jgi:hypothetical protein
MARRLANWAGFLIAFALLTGLTQIGGLVLAGAVGATRVWRLGAWKGLGLFCLLYGAATLVVVPALAPVFGRVPLSCSGDAYQPQSLFYCATNRHYVRPVVRQALDRVAARMSAQFPGSVVSFLDAGFPFDLMPMPPHLSHGDGRKIDLALFYQGRDAGGVWALGYWAFPRPPARTCAKDGLFRWHMSWLQPHLPAHALDEVRTKALVAAILAEKPRRVFLEPHLVTTLGVVDDRIVFAGCHAARHDDHVHAEWRP